MKKEAAIRARVNRISDFLFESPLLSSRFSSNECHPERQPLDLQRNYNYDLELIKKIGSFFLMT